MIVFKYTFVIIILIIAMFSISCVGKNVQVTETYTDAEMKQESYTVTEPYVEMEPVKEIVLDETFRCGRINCQCGGTSCSTSWFTITKPNTCVEAIFQEIGNWRVGQIYLFGRTDGGLLVTAQKGTYSCNILPGEYYYHWSALYPSKFEGDNKLHVTVTMQLSGITEKVTKYREVIKYRQVPVEIKRQRTVIKTIQVPFWEAIFSK